MRRDRSGRHSSPASPAGRLLPGRAPPREGLRGHGIIRRSSSFNTARIDHLYRTRTSASSSSSLRRPQRRLLAQPSSVHDPAGRGLQPRRAEPRPRQLRHSRVHRRRRPRSARCGCSRRSARRASRCRFYQASLERDVRQGRETPQTETTPFHPRSPYGVRQGVTPTGSPATTARLRHVRGQRDPLQPRVAAARRDVRHPQDHARGRRTSSAASRKSSTSGNLDAKRDWGYAPEYVEAMWRMLQAGRARRLRARHGRDALRARVPRRGLRPRRPRLERARARSTSATSARPRSICCSAMPPRRRRSSAGSRRSVPELVRMHGRPRPRATADRRALRVSRLRG